MTISIEASGQACGARVSGVDLGSDLSPEILSEIRGAWLEYHVLSFPEQDLGSGGLERATALFGPFGEDPFIESVPGREHVLALRRAADETAPVFAESWHSDWSFQKNPPAGTMLHAQIVPPVGGDTLFANQHLALEKMPAARREAIVNLVCVHSAKHGYGKGGLYGEADRESVRAMTIISSDRAEESELHKMVKAHPETGRDGLFGCLGYICGIESMGEDESLELLAENLAWQTHDELQYCHQWEPDMLVVWDNRSVLHRATSGYDGYERLLFRTTFQGPTE